MTQRIKNVPIKVPAVLNGLDNAKKATTKQPKVNAQKEIPKPLSRTPSRRDSTSSSNEEDQAQDQVNVTFKQQDISNLKIKIIETEIYLKNCYYLDMQEHIPVQLLNLVLDRNLAQIKVFFINEKGDEVTDELEVSLDQLYTSNISNENPYDSSKINLPPSNDPLMYTFQEQSTLYDDLAQNQNTSAQPMRTESSYMQNPLYLKVCDQVQKEFGDQYLEEYKREYLRQLHVLDKKVSLVEKNAKEFAEIMSRQAEKKKVERDHGKSKHAGDQKTHPSEDLTEQGRFLKLGIAYLKIRDYHSQPLYHKYETGKESIIQAMVEKLQNKLNFDPQFLQTNLALQNATIDTTTRFITGFIKQNIQELDQVLNNYINYVKNGLKALLALKAQFAKLNVQEILMNPAYKLQSQDRKNQASQQILSISQGLFLPDENALTKQFEEIETMINRIKQLQPQQQYQAYLLLFWRTIVPYTFYIVSGGMYLSFYQKQINQILKWLQSGTGQATEVQHYKITQVYIQVLRCFEYNVYQLILTFLKFIEKEVIFTDRKFLIDMSGKQTAKQEETGKFLTEILLKMNFKTNPGEYFERSFYKEEVSLRFKTLPGFSVDAPLDEQLESAQKTENIHLPADVEQFLLFIDPNVTDLCQSLQDKLKLLYVTFICIPICLSKNYFYIGKGQDEGWKDLLHFYENKGVQKQSAYMQHYETVQSDQIQDMQYTVLLQNQETKIHLFKETIIGNFGLLPSIFVIDTQNSTVNAIEERFKHISGTIELVCDVVKERILQNNCLKFIQQFLTQSNMMSTIQLAIDVEETPADQIKKILDEPEQVSAFVSSYQLQISQIDEIPDFLYQYMLKLDLRPFKQQYRDFLKFWYNQIARQTLYMIRKYCESIKLRSEHFLQLFNKPITPDTIEESRNIIDILNGQDKKQIFQTNFDTVEFILDQYQQNFSNYFTLEDNDVTSSSEAMVSFVQLCKLTDKQSKIVAEYESLFKELVVNIQGFMKIQSQEFQDYYKELLKVKLDDIKEASNYAAHFRQVFAVLSQDFKLTAFDIQQQQRSELCKKYKDQELGFYANFAAATKLQVYSKRYSNQQLLNYSNIYQQRQNITEVEKPNEIDREHLTELQLYIRPNSTSNEGFNIVGIVCELMFVVVEYSKLQELLTTWEHKLKVPADQKVLDFTTAVLRVTDLYKAVCYSSYLDNLYNNQELTLDKVTHGTLLLMTDDAAHSINNMKDNYVKSLSIQNVGGQIEMQFTFINWKDYVDVIQQTFLRQIGFLTFLYYMSSKDFSAIHIKHVKQYTLLDLNQPELITIKELQEVYEKNHQIIDYLKILVDDAEKNHEAQEILQYIEDLFGNVEVERVVQTDYMLYPIIHMSSDPRYYKNKIEGRNKTRAREGTRGGNSRQLDNVPRTQRASRASLNQNQSQDEYKNYHYKAIYDFVEISHVQSVQILNNISFQQAINPVEVQVNKYVTELEQLKENMDKYRYDPVIEQKSRNIEAVSLYIKFLITLLRYTPLLIEFMKFVQEKCFMIQNEVKKKDQFQLQHPFLDFKISFLSQAENNVITQQQLIWNEMVVKTFSQGTRLVTLVSNAQLLKNLQSIYQSIHAVQQRLFNDKNLNIFTLFKAPMYFTIQGGAAVGDDGISHDAVAQNRLIPLINGKLYPHYLLFPKILNFTFGTFPQEFSFFKVVNTLSDTIFPHVSDIVITHSPLRGRLILGLRSKGEYLEFINPRVAPPTNFMIPDTILPGIRETMIDKLKNAYDPFFQTCNELIHGHAEGVGGGGGEHGATDTFHEELNPILMTRLQDFMTSHLTFISFVLMQTFIKRQLAYIITHYEVIDLNEISKNEIFTDVFKSLIVFREAIKALKQQSGKIEDDILQSWTNMVESYLRAFKVLEKEMHFKVATIVKQHAKDRGEVLTRSLNASFARNDTISTDVDVNTTDGPETDTESEENVINKVQKVSLLSLLAQSETQLPLLEFDHTHNELYVTTSDNSCMAKCGSWWPGHDPGFMDCNPLQFRIINNLVQGYNSSNPIIICANEHKFYDNERFYSAIDMFRRYIFRRTISVFVNYHDFAHSLQEIESYLMCGYITVIYGTEYLTSSQVYELVGISNTVRRKFGEFQGILVPFIDQQIIDQNNAKAENHIPISMRNARYSDFLTLGTMIFIVPQLSSVMAANKFIHVIPLDERSTVSDSLHGQPTMTFDISQSFCVQESSQNSETGGGYNGSQSKIQKRIGSNYYIPMNTLNQKGKSVLDLFQFKLQASLELIHISTIYSQISPQWGQQFYEINCFLKQLNPKIPKISMGDIQYIQSLCTNKTAYQVAAIMLDFILKMQIYIFLLDKNQVQFNKMIAQFLGASFGLRPDEINRLVRMAKANFQYQINIIAKLNIPIPRFIDVHHMSFDQYFDEYVMPTLDQKQKSFYIVMQKVYKLNKMIVNDIQLIKELSKEQKPMLLISPQITYARSLLNIFVGVFQRHGLLEFCYDMQVVEELLIQLQYNNRKPLVNADNPMIQDESAAPAQGIKSTGSIQNQSSSSNKSQPKFDISQKQFIVCLVVNSEHDLEAARPLIMALTVPKQRYMTQVGIPVDFSVLKVQLILLSDNIMVHKIMESDTLAFLPHKMIIYPHIDSIQSAQQMYPHKMRYDPEEVFKYMMMKKGDPFNQPETNTLLQQIQKKYQYILDNQLDKRLENFNTRYKTSILDKVFHGVISFLVSYSDHVFEVNQSFDEQMLLSTMFYYNLYKFGVMSLLNRKIMENKFSSRTKLDIFQYLQLNHHAIKQEMQTKLNDNLKGSDLNGLFYRLDEDASLWTQIKHQIRQQYYNIAETLPYNAEFAGFNGAEYLRRGDVFRAMAKQSKQGGEKDSSESSSQKSAPRISDVANSASTAVVFGEQNQTGIGNYGAYHFAFSGEWVRQRFFETGSITEGIENLLTVALAALWNTYSHYYLVYLHAHGEEQELREELNTRYKSLLSGLKQHIVQSSAELFQNNYVDLLLQIIHQARGLDDGTIGVETWDNVLDTCTQFNQTSFEQNKRQIQESAEKVIEKILQSFPMKYTDDTYSYLWYDQLENKIEFIEYKLGKGLLNSVTDETNQQIAERQMIEQAMIAKRYHSEYNKQMAAYNKAVEAIVQAKNNENAPDVKDDEARAIVGAEVVREKQEDKTELKKPVYMPPLLRQEDVVSIQRISKNGSPLVIDPQRACLISFIAQAMLCPFSFMVYGLRSAGKTILTDIAKMVVREVVVPSQTFLKDPNNKTDVWSTIHAILGQCILVPMQRFSNYVNQRTIRQDTGNNKADQQVFMFKRQGFPSLHINLSEVTIDSFDHDFPILLRDHVVWSGNHIFGAQFNKQFGTIQLQDLSIVLEVTSQSYTEHSSMMKIEVPAFTERYIERLTGAYWPRESVEWRKQFSRGISLIRQSLPPGLINSYGLFEKMYDAYLLTFNSVMNTRGVNKSEFVNLFINSKDGDLCRGSIHSLFGALRNRSDVTQATTTDVAERLATLSILKLLENEDASKENPWQDCGILIKSQSQLIPCWERTILQRSLDFCAQLHELEQQNQQAHNKQYAKELISQNKHGMRVINTAFKPIRLLSPLPENSIIRALELSDQSLFLTLSLFAPRPEALIGVTSTYSQIGQHLDPIITCRLFETFIYTTKIKEIGRARISSLFQYNNTQSALPLSGQYGKDSFQQIVKYLLGLTQKNYVAVIKQANELRGTNIQLSEDDDDFVEAEDLPSMTNFAGFTLTDKLSLKVSKASLIFENVNQIQYQEAVQLIANFSDYKIFNQAMFDTINHAAQKDEALDDLQSDSMSQSSQSSAQSAATQYGAGGQQQKLLFELSSILNSINQQQKQYKSVSKSQQSEIMQILKQVTMEGQTSTENQDFIVLFLVCRLALAYAIGINPMHVLPILGQSNAVRSRYSLALPLCNNMPYEIVSSGRQLIQRLPQAVTVAADFNKYIVDTFCDQETRDLNSVEYNKQGLKDPEQNQDELLQRFQFAPMQICIVAPKSLMMLKDSAGTTLMQYLTYSTEQLCHQEGLFTHEELVNIALIVSKEHGLATTMDTEDIVSILATNLQIILIDDCPLQAQYEYNQNFKIRVIGTCKSPVYEYVKNFQQIHNYAYSELQKTSYGDNAGTSIAQNVDKKVKQNLQSKQNLIAQSEILKQAENNLIMFRPQSFISLYKVAGCHLFNKIDLPDRLQLNWDYQQSVFGLAVISVFQYCAQNARRASISLAQFSHHCARVCNLLFSKYEYFLKRLNTVFSAFRYFEILATVGTKSPTIMQLKDFEFTQFRQIVMRESGFDNNESEHYGNVQHLAIAEVIHIRDAIHTLIEGIKPYYKLIQQQLQTTVFESVCAVAYMFFNLNQQISDEFCQEQLDHDKFGELVDKELDPFSTIMVAVMRQAGLQVKLFNQNTINNKQDSNRKAICLNCRNAKGMFLSNIINILGMDNPVQFILEMNHIAWKPGDFAQKALFTTFICYQLGINTFVASEEMGQSVALMCAILQRNPKEETPINFNSFYEVFMQQGQQKQQAAQAGGSNQAQMMQGGAAPKQAAGSHQLNTTYQHFKDYCTIIDLESDPKAILIQLIKIFESTNQTLVFTNCGSRKANPTNENFVSKLIKLKNTHSYKKNHQIQIGNQTINMYQDLHHYNFILCLADGLDYEDYMHQVNLYQQDVYNKMMVIQEDKSKTDDGQMLQDMLIQSIYGMNFSLRQQDYFQVILSYMTSIQLEKTVAAMRKYLQISLSKLAGAGQMIKDTQLEMVIAQQIEQMQGSNSAVLGVVKQVVCVNSDKQPQHLVDFLKQTQTILVSLYQKFYNDQDHKSIDKSIIEQMEYRNIVRGNGGMIAQQISGTLSIVMYVLQRLSYIHSPFIIFGTKSFSVQIGREIIEQLPGFLQKYVVPMIQAKTGVQNINMVQTLIYCTKQEPQLLVQQISKIILPLLLKRVFPSTHLVDAIGIYVTLKFLFLALIGLISNTSTEQPMAMSNKPLFENLKVYNFLVNALQVNRSNHYKLLLYSGLSTQLGEIYPCGAMSKTKQYKSVNTLLPAELVISKQMQIIWLWIVSLAKDHNLIKEAIHWFRIHLSTIAGFSESKNAFESMISYYMEQASVGNPLCEQIMVQLNASGCLNEISDRIDVSNKNMIQQMPVQFDAPTPSVMTTLMVLLSVCQPENFIQNLSLIDIYLTPYTNISFKDMHECVVDAEKCQSGVISDQPVPTGLMQKIQKQMSLSLANLLEQFNIYYDVKQPIPHEFVSEAVYSLCDVSSRVFKQVESNMQNMRYDPNIQSVFPVIFIFYDRSISAFHLLRFCQHLQFGDPDSKLIQNAVFVDKKPELSDLSRYCIIQTLDQRANGLAYCKHITQLLHRYKQWNKKTQMMPIFVLVPTNAQTTYMQATSDNNGSSVTQEYVIQFNAALKDLANEGQAHYIYIRQQEQIDKAFKHYISLACAVIALEVKTTPAELMAREDKKALNQNPHSPSLDGFVCLCMKYAILMAKENVSFWDNDFVATISQIININNLDKLEQEIEHFEEEHDAHLAEFLHHGHHEHHEHHHHHHHEGEHGEHGEHPPEGQAQDGAQAPENAPDAAPQDEKVENVEKVETEDKKEEPAEQKEPEKVEEQKAPEKSSEKPAGEKPAGDDEESYSGSSYSTSGSSSSSQYSQRNSVFQDVMMLRDRRQVSEDQFQTLFTESLVNALQMHFVDPSGRAMHDIFGHDKVISVSRQLDTIESKMKVIEQQLHPKKEKVMPKRKVTVDGMSMSIESEMIQKMEIQYHSDKPLKEKFESKLLATFNLVKGGQLPVANYDLKAIKKSTISLLFMEDRHLENVKIVATQQGKHFHVPEGLDSVESISEFFHKLNIFCLDNNRFFSQENTHKLLPCISTNSAAISIRQVMSSHFTADALHELVHKGHDSMLELERMAELENQEQMEGGMRTFVTNLANYKNLHFNQFSNYTAPQNMLEGLLNDYMVETLYERGIYGNAGFMDFGDHGEINALVFGGVLGDIFYYMMVQSAAELQIPLNAVRLVVMTEPPLHQPYLRPDGSIVGVALEAPDAGDGTDAPEYQQQQLGGRPRKELRPYYLTIYNMELIGANYDFELGSIVDQSQENLRGYKTHMKLYATVAIVDTNDRSYVQTIQQKHKLPPGQHQKKVRIPKGYVPVALQVGGYIKPYVMLRNKTDVPDRVWTHRAIYFGVKFM